MASRNPYSSLNHRDPRPASSSLFDGYPGSAAATAAADRRSRPASAQQSPAIPTAYGYNNAAGGNPYAHANGSGFRPATPNSKGQYATSVLSSLESQPPEDSASAFAASNAQASLLANKVSQLKQLTVAIGDEIRDSTTLAGKMNDSFDRTSVRLRGTMRRMLRMAERTGVGWKAWLGFFAAVFLLFVYVWLF